MTPHELKNWLRGFAEAISEETPTPAQWAIIKAKLSEAEPEPAATQTRHTWGAQTYPQQQQNLPNTRDAQGQAVGIFPGNYS